MIERSDLAIGVDIEREDRILQFGDPERKGWRIEGDEVQTWHRALVKMLQFMVPSLEGSLMLRDFHRLHTQSLKTSS